MEDNILILTPKPPADSPVKTKCVASNKLKWWLRWFMTFLEKCHHGNYFTQLLDYWGVILLSIYRQWCSLTSNSDQERRNIEEGGKPLASRERNGPEYSFSMEWVAIGCLRWISPTRPCVASAVWHSHVPFHLFSFATLLHAHFHHHHLSSFSQASTSW